MIGWLTPVRLDDCEIPHFDLGAGRTLSSLQPVDLFGAREADQSRRLIAQVRQILATAGQLTSGSGPVTLPADSEIFTGRAALLDELLERLDPAGEQTGVTVVSAVDGMGGVGKTALAIHAARAAHDRGWFPGGVLLENMLGFSAADPVDYGSAAARLLRALGVAHADVPDIPEGRSAAWRDRLRRLGEQDRPLLIVLDNVATAGQVLPLLPGPPHRMLIASRHTLSADRYTHAARRHEAARLLARNLADLKHAYGDRAEVVRLAAERLAAVRQPLLPLDCAGGLAGDV